MTVQNENNDRFLVIRSDYFMNDCVIHDKNMSYVNSCWGYVRKVSGSMFMLICKLQSYIECFVSNSSIHCRLPQYCNMYTILNLASAEINVYHYEVLCSLKTAVQNRKYTSALQKQSTNCTIIQPVTIYYIHVHMYLKLNISLYTNASPQWYTYNYYNFL